jgi:hypothetical protein
MEFMDYWRLCEELTVVQAVLLIVDADPDDHEYVLGWKPNDRPTNFSAAFAALSHAVLGGRLAATKRMIIDSKWDTKAEERYEYETAEPDWGKTTINVEDLKIWLKNRGVKTGFFFPQGDDTPDFLDSRHSNFSPKLAAAICAW